MRVPVKTRNTPNRSRTHSKRRRAAPMAMKIARKTTAPRIPKKRTRCWYLAGMLKKFSTTTNTKMLSTEREYSTT
jgi:hypothetical protein